MDYAIPVSKISSLSSREFVGFVADNTQQKIKLKVFHCEVQNNHEELKKKKIIIVLSLLQSKLRMKIFKKIISKLKLKLKICLKSN